MSDYFGRFFTIGVYTTPDNFPGVRKITTIKPLDNTFRDGLTPEYYVIQDTYYINDDYPNGELHNSVEGFTKARELAHLIFP